MNRSIFGLWSGRLEGPKHRSSVGKGLHAAYSHDTGQKNKSGREPERTKLPSTSFIIIIINVILVIKINSYSLYKLMPSLWHYILSCSSLSSPTPFPIPVTLSSTFRSTISDNLPTLPITISLLQ